MGCITALFSYFLAENSAKERVIYSSTGIWNVFINCIDLLLEKLRCGESQIQFHNDMECILD